VNLIGLIITVFHDTRSPERQILIYGSSHHKHYVKFQGQAECAFNIELLFQVCLLYYRKCTMEKSVTEFRTILRSNKPTTSLHISSSYSLHLFF